MGHPGQPGPYGYGPTHPGQPGFPGGQPPKRKTGLIVGLSIAALVVIGGVVALILVFTSDDEKNAAPGPASSPAGTPAVPPPGSAPGPGDGQTDSLPQPGPGDDSSGNSSPGDVAEVKQLAEKAVQAINNRDEELAKEIACNGAANMSDLPEGAVFSTNGDPAVNGDTATLPMKVTYQGKTEEGEFTAKKQADGWCMG